MFEGWKDRIEHLNLRNDDRPAFPRTTCDIPMPPCKPPKSLKEELKMFEDVTPCTTEIYNGPQVSAKELRTMLSENIITLKEYRNELRSRIGLYSEKEEEA